MDANIIDWRKTPKGNDLEVLSVFYALKNVCETLARGAEVADLKLEIDGEDKVSEEGFREFLKSITATQWNESELNDNQIKSLNRIQEYLKTGHTQEAQPKVRGAESLADLIKNIKQ